jgi:hypothetical protein
MMAALSERRWRGSTVDRIADEQTAEEHDLRHQKHPHPQTGDLLLLLDIVKLADSPGFRGKISTY